VQATKRLPPLGVDNINSYMHDTCTPHHLDLRANSALSHCMLCLVFYNILTLALTLRDYYQTSLKPKPNVDYWLTVVVYQ
jgi:hypothetical protein